MTPTHHRARPLLHHRARPLALGLVLALALVLLPAEQVVAQEIAPETREADLSLLEDEVASPGGDGEVASPGGDDDEASPGGEDADEVAEALDVAELDEHAPAEAHAGEADEDARRDRRRGPRGRDGRSKITEAPFAFSGLGFKGPDHVDAVAFRVRGSDGAWTAWEPVERQHDEDGPDPDTEEAAAARSGGWISEPIWVGEATHLQVAVRGGELEDLDITVVDTMGLSESLLTRARRALAGLGTQQQAAEAAARPNIITRAQWGANESWRKGTPSYAAPKMVVLHHTATTNAYTQAEAAGQIRNMYNWHTNHNGWNDIGYNLLVDRFGNIYEGRAGGVEQGVIGAHATNWNTGSVGIAVIGNHETTAPSAVAVGAVIRALAWKYEIHDINPDPSARVTHNSRSVPTMVGHRDVGSTSCPGRFLVSRMDDIRHGIFVNVGAADWTPVVGDWNGNGVDTVGWFRDGHWRMRDTNTTGSPTRAFSFGTVGDKPVVGDWNGDGRDTVGIVRNGHWHLKNTNEGGAADLSFYYGTAADHPLVGDWNGTGRDTIGIVRGGEWHLRNSLAGGVADRTFVYGQILNGDIPIVGNWNGSGGDTIGIVRGGEWHLRNSLAGGVADQMFVYGQVLNGDVPVVGNWNGSGGDTIGVTRDRTWYLRNAISGGPASLTFVFE